MKKPRLPTPEELADWQESNRGTKVRKGVVSQPVSVRANQTIASEAKPIAAKDKEAVLPAAKVKNKPPLKPLPVREARRVFNTSIEATLDLHGMGKLDAYVRVQQFVMRAHCSGRRHVAIITGKGRMGEAGVLRSNLPHWLNEPALRPLISAFATARAEKGGDGLTHVLLKRSS